MAVMKMGSIAFVCFVWLLLFYAIATVFHVYHDGDMIYEMRRKKPESTLSQFKGSGSCGEMDCSTDKCYCSDQHSYPCAQGHLPRALTNWAISSPPGNIARRREWNLAFRAIVLTITPPGLHEITTFTMPTCLCGPITDMSVLTTTMLVPLEL